MDEDFCIKQKCLKIAQECQNILKIKQCVKNANNL